MHKQDITEKLRIMASNLKWTADEIERLRENCNETYLSNGGLV